MYNPRLLHEKMHPVKCGLSKTEPTMARLRLNGDGQMNGSLSFILTRGNWVYMFVGAPSLEWVNGHTETQALMWTKWHLLHLEQTEAQLMAANRRRVGVWSTSTCSRKTKTNW